MNFISKTREGAKVFSRQSGTHELDQTNLPGAMLSSTSKMGTASVDQLQLGVDYPNTQSAIDDLVNAYQVPINCVVTFADSLTTPGGDSMEEELVFTGEATGTLIHVYGVPVQVDIGDNAVAVSTKALAVLNKYKDAKIAIKTAVAVPGFNDKLKVSFLDTNPHANYNYSSAGITIAGLTTTPAKPGYGSWTKIGTGIIKDGSGADVTLHYYKRTA